MKATFIGLLLIIGIVCLIVFFPPWKRDRAVHWYWIPIESPEDPTLPANIAALEDAALLEGILKFKAGARLARYKSQDLGQNLSGEELLRFVDDIEKLGPESPTEIVVFCSAHGVLEDGKPMLVPQRGEKQNFLDLIQRLDRLEHVDHVLLLLDVSRCGVHCWKLGNVANGFAGRLHEELSRPGEESLARVSVLLSAGLHEQSWLQPDQSASVFARVLSEGLLGHADGWTADGPGGPINKVVSTDELSHYTIQHVAQWVEENRGVRQTVRYYPARAEPFHLVSVGSDPPEDIADWRKRIVQSKAESAQVADVQKDEPEKSSKDAKSEKPSKSKDDPKAEVKQWIAALAQLRESGESLDSVAGSEDRIQLPRAGWMIREANWNARFELMYSKAEMLITLAAANPAGVNDFRREMIESHLRKLREHLQRKDARYEDLFQGAGIRDGMRLSTRDQQISTLSLPLAGMLLAPTEAPSDSEQPKAPDDPLVQAYAIEVQPGDAESAKSANEAMKNVLAHIRDSEIPVHQLSESLVNRFEQMRGLPPEACRNFAFILNFLGQETNRQSAYSQQKYDEMWPAEVLLLKRIVIAATDPEARELGWKPDTGSIRRLFDLRKSAEQIAIADSSLPLFRNQFKQMELDLISAERWLMPPVVGGEEQARIHLDRAAADYERLRESWQQHRDLIQASGEIASSAPGIASYLARRLEAELGVPSTEQARHLIDMVSGENAEQLPSGLVLDPQLKRLWTELFGLWRDAKDFAGNEDQLYDEKGELNDRWKSISNRWQEVTRLVRNERDRHLGRTIANWQARSAALALPISLRDPQGLAALWESGPTADSTVAPNDGYGVWDGYLAIAMAKLLEADVSFDPWLNYVEELNRLGDPQDISLKKLSALTATVRQAAAFKMANQPVQTPESTDGLDDWLALKQEIWRRRRLSESEREIYRSIAERTEFESLEEEPGLWIDCKLPPNDSLISSGDALSLEGFDPPGGVYRLSVSRNDDNVVFNDNRTQLPDLQPNSLGEYRATLTGNSSATLTLLLTQRDQSGTVMPLDVGFVRVAPKFDPSQWGIVFRTAEDDPRDLNVRPLQGPGSYPDEHTWLKGNFLDIPSMNFDKDGRTMSYDETGHPSDLAPPLPVSIFLTGPSREDIDRQVNLSVKRWLPDEGNGKWSVVAKQTLKFPKRASEIPIPALEEEENPPNTTADDAAAREESYDIAHGLLFEIQVGDQRIEHLFQPSQKPVGIRVHEPEIARSQEGTGFDVRVSFSYDEPDGTNPAHPAQFPVKLRLLPDDRPGGGGKQALESIVSSDENIDHQLYMSLSEDYFANEEVLRIAVAGYPRVWEYQLKEDTSSSYEIRRDVRDYLRLILVPPEKDRVAYRTAGQDSMKQPEDLIEAYVDIDFQELVEPDDSGKAVWDNSDGAWRRKEATEWYLVLEYEPIASGDSKGRLVFPETARKYERIYWREPREIRLIQGPEGWQISSKISLRKYQFKLPQGAVDRFQLRAYLTDADSLDSDDLSRTAELSSSPPQKLIIDTYAPPMIELQGPNDKLNWNRDVRLQVSAEDRISGIQLLRVFVDTDGNGMLDPGELKSPVYTERFDAADEESRKQEREVSIRFERVKQLFETAKDRSVAFFASATNGAGITSEPKAMVVRSVDPPAPSKKTGTLQVSLPRDSLGGAWTIKWEGEESDSRKTRSTSFKTELAVGKYKVFVENNRRKLKEPKEVTIKAGQPTSLTLGLFDLPLN